MTAELEEISAKLGDRIRLTDREVATLIATPDILWLGSLADTCRRARHGDRATYVRVYQVDSASDVPDDTTEVPSGAGEVRIVARPRTLDETLSLAARVAGRAGPVPVTAYALDHLADLCDGHAPSLERALLALREVGVAMVAEADAESRELGNWLAASRAAGLDVARIVVRRASDGRFPSLVRAIVDCGAELDGVHAFAPLPQILPAPLTTGYSDVRQVALARLLVDNIESIQVDWPLYGPKLAQVALTFGADDIDGVSPLDDTGHGRRRRPVEEITRNIRAAALVPVERTGCFERRDP